jgi:glutathione synthase/RimK-type ligase-like ATP-grasp enzyme
VDWSAFDLIVIRSCWDYHLDPAAFIAWAEQAGPMVNPPQALAWNIDKHYLAGLGAAGLAVVPTSWLPPGEADPEGVLAQLTGWRGRWVVKPAISLAGLDTGAYDLGDAVERRQLIEHVRRLQRAGRSTMLQPFQESIQDCGETSMVFVNGKLSHSVRRSAVITGPDDGADHRFTPPPTLHVEMASPTTAELAFARSVLARVPTRSELLYARVDIVTGNAQPRLMEVELIEPQLFLGLSTQAGQRLARAITARASHSADHPLPGHHETDRRARDQTHEPRNSPSR